MDAEFDSLSNGTTFKGGHPTKNRGFAQNTEIYEKSYRYILLTVVPRVVLAFSLIVLDAESIFLSNGTTCRGRSDKKQGVWPEIRNFGPNPVGISCSY
jgi:hypothetical protein